MGKVYEVWYVDVGPYFFQQIFNRSKLWFLTPLL